MKLDRESENMVKTSKANLKEKCPRCVKGTLVTDHESGEMF